MRTASVAVVAMAALVAGCGGGGSSGSGGKPQTPEARYAQAANRICRQTAALAPTFPGTRDQNGGLQTTAGQVIPYLQEVSKITRRSLRQFKALQAPASEQAQVEKLLAAQQARIDGLELALAAARKGDGRGFTAAFQRDQRETGPRYVRLAAKLGLNACAS